MVVKPDAVRVSRVHYPFGLRNNNALCCVSLAVPEWAGARRHLNLEA